MKDFEQTFTQQMRDANLDLAVLHKARLAEMSLEAEYDYIWRYNLSERLFCSLVNGLEIKMETPEQGRWGGVESADFFLRYPQEAEGRVVIVDKTYQLTYWDR